MDDNLPSEGLLRIDVTGKDPALWTRLRARFVAIIEDTLEMVANYRTGATVRDEARQVLAGLVDSCKARLARPGLENERIEAEIGRLFAEAEREQAEARIKHAQADAIELENIVKRLRFALSLVKCVMVGQNGEEAVLLSSQIEAALGSLGQLTIEESKLLD